MSNAPLAAAESTSSATPAALARATLSGFDAGPLRNVSRRASRWRKSEYLFWLLPIVAYFVFPSDLALLSQIAITALFVISLDLILGYAGIVSLGHAAFFGIGAYAAGLLAKGGLGDPLVGLVAAAGAAALLGFVTSFLVLRGADLTRLMVTLGVGLMLFEAANKLTPITGGLDGLQGIEVKHCWVCSDSIWSVARPTSTASWCCSCCSGSRGASSIHRSASRCRASGSTRFGCPPWARR